MSALASPRTALLCLAAAMTPGCSHGEGRPEPAREGQAAILEGERDAEHAAVFRMLARDDGLNGLCTAVLIAPNVLVTARHCVAEVPQGPVHCGEHPFGDALDWSEILVSNDVEPTLTSAWREITEVVVPDGTHDLCGSDVALLALATPVPDDVATPLSPAVDAPPESGQSYVAVGYGGTADEAAASYGERRSRSGLRVTCGTADSCPESTATRTEFVGETGVCSGDSGGPALTADGEVLGVASRGTEGCQNPVYSALQPWKAWIAANLERLGHGARSSQDERSQGCSFAGDSGRSEPAAPPWLFLVGCACVASQFRRLARA